MVLDMHQVLFYSKTGNTKKLADAIAQVIGATSVHIKTASIDPTSDIIFLGSGCYGSKPGVEMMEFIDKNDFLNRKVSVFGTSDGDVG
jgi:flavodoxin